MNAPLTLPAPAAADTLASLPAWLYRSEAFAEDLPMVEAPRRAAPAPQPAAGSARASGLLYLATLGLALASIVPTALLGA